MAVTSVGIRELKAQLARYVRQVKAGGTVTITERGKPIGRIIPIKISTEDRVKNLLESGMAHWNGHRLKPFRPKVRPRGKRTVADILLENRE